jgi:hypothetical protein
MDRRKFLSLSGAGAGAVAVAVPLAARGAAPPEARAAGQARLPLKARLGHQFRGSDDATLAWLARFGVEGVCASATLAESSRLFATAEEMMRLREKVEKHGLTLDLTDSVLKPSRTTSALAPPRVFPWSNTT